MSSGGGPERVVIIGGGLAGYRAATALRTLGHAGTIMLIDAEAATYDRPPLSKQLFTPDFSLDALAFASADDLTAAGIESRFSTRVGGVDAENMTVTLEDGEVIAADAIVLATGGQARVLAVPGSELPQVHTLRTFDDAAALRETVDEGTRVVVVGAGLIGAELASALRLRGAVVTLIDPVAVPLEASVGARMAARLHDMHTEHGIVTIQGEPAAFENSGENVDVVLTDGTRVPADRVIMGVGLVPSTELAEAAGLEVADGIVVDAQQRTSAAGIFAAGDAVRVRDADGALQRRAEHWDAAGRDGERAAAAILGKEAAAPSCDWFWSDRHGVHLEVVGRLTGPGETVVREGTNLTVFHVAAGLLVGAAAVDDSMTIRAARRLIDQRIPVTSAELADPAVRLRDLLKSASASARKE